MMLVIILLCSSGVAYQAMATGVSSARSQLTLIHQQLQYNQHKVAYLTSRAAVLQGQLTDLSAQLQQTSQRLVQLRQNLRMKEQSIERTNIRVQKASRREGELNLLLRQRLRIMYENGSVSYLDVLFGSNSFSDFLNRLTAVSLIIQQNTQLFQQAQAQHTKLALIDKRLTQERLSLVTLTQQVSSKQRLQAQSLQGQQLVLADMQTEKQQALTNLQQESAAEQSIAATIAQLLRSNPKLSDTTKLHLGTGAWVWPVPNHTDITSGYGNRLLFGSINFHNGIDIGAPAGTPIVAVADGVVLYAGVAEGFGHWIVLKHAGGLLTIYGHMYASGLLVQPGQVVKQGQVIAYVGSDGQATGPHLHFSVATGFNAQGFPVTLNPLGYVHS